MAIKSIVVGTDGSETSYRAFAMAVGFAVREQGCVHACFVAHLPGAASPPMPSRSKRCSSSRRRSASSRSSLPGYPSSRSVRHSSRRTLCYTPQQSKRRPAVYALPRLRWRCPGCSPKRPRCCSSPEHRRCHHLEENPAAAELVLDEVALVTLDQAACS